MGDIADEYANQAASELGDLHAGTIAEVGPDDFRLAKGDRRQLENDWPEAEVQTDKAIAKIVTCTSCEKPLIVNTFYAPASAKCSDHRTSGGAAPGTQQIVQKGRTDPARAANLVDSLINPHFGHALCPVHPDDPEHIMELKSVNHNERYGPSTLIGRDARGRAEYRQDGPGETVMHQCLHCKAVVTYSTTAQQQYRRINEVLTAEHRHSGSWGTILGAREEDGE